jgi:hypothetical protein
VPHRVPPHECLHGRQRRLREHHHPAVPAHQGRGGHPATQGLLGGAEVGAAQQCPAVEQQRGTVAALGDRFGADGGDHERGPVVDVFEDFGAARATDRDVGERPAQFLSRALGADDDGA